MGLGQEQSVKLVMENNCGEVKYYVLACLVDLLLQCSPFSRH